MRAKKHKRRRKLAGYTMMELLAVLGIIGILVSMALPTFKPLLVRTKSVEATEHLKHLVQMEQGYYFIHSKYSDKLSDIDFVQSKLVSDGGTANYKIEVTKADNKGFIATATSITDFDGDGTFNVWQIDQEGISKEVVPD
ncbi:MAG: type IV pilin protein [Bacteroidia bacterium]